MAFIYCNPNPTNSTVGDCVIRGIAIALNITWEQAYTGVTLKGYEMYDMPSSNRVWGEYLYSKGFRRHIIPDTCPNCYTINQFANDNPEGVYLLATGSHVVAVIDGNYYDTWDSGNEIPIYFWRKEE